MITDPNEYVSKANVTENLDIKGITPRLTSANSFVPLLHKIVKDLNHLDVYKKRIFYGKNPNDVEEYVELDTESLNCLNTNTAIQRDNIRLLHAVVGILTEGNELLEALLKTIVDGEELDIVNVSEEAGDLHWYQSRINDITGVTMPEQWTTNLKKLYPRNKIYDAELNPTETSTNTGFNAESTINRDTEAERKILEGTND